MLDKEKIIEMYRSGKHTSGTIARILELKIHEVVGVIVEWLKK